MTITEVSKQFDLTPDTLRYYERIGLIPPVSRNKSGVRDYDENSCRWIQLMKCLRKAGVQIEALIEYVALFQKGDETVDARKGILIEQRNQLLDKLEDIKETIKILNRKIDRYEDGLMTIEKGLK
ncbi:MULTISPECIES: MerR family transcriptional regulator [Fusobacterium]|uniref:MerR family transcriptional regulator n=1 Tax=Fusobacterium TaxID=848 RepID=UPI00241C1DA6|nr:MULTISPECIES: MerR family transcriptional regulator [Fusobacterium]MDH6456864.1 DNA-binding transcriptional MerR regulator [Fusobacterium sp. PH5-7]MEE0137897.1 MerR family transcriptional regulator [Fusobacterium ulcerans]